MTLGLGSCIEENIEPIPQFESDTGEIYVKPVQDTSPTVVLYGGGDDEGDGGTVPPPPPSGP